MANENKYFVLLTVFIAVVSILNLMSVKMIEIGALTTTFGAYLYALTFPCTDVVAEVWGKERAQQMVKLGFLAYVIVAIVLVFALFHPPASFWVESNQSFVGLFGVVPRILLGSAFAFIVAQSYDVWIFHKIKDRSDGTKLWLRNNISTGTSQLLDSVVFVTIAFAGTLPTSELFSMIFGTYIVKLVIAVVDTPIVYLLVSWARR